MASGVAAHLGVDPALVRVGLVVLLFAGGLAIPLYVAAWLLIPEADADEAAATQLIRERGVAFWIGIGLLVLVALVVADEVIGGRGVWPLVLIAAGIALWRAGQESGRSGSHPTPSAHRARQEPTVPLADTRDHPGAGATDSTSTQANVPPPAHPSGPRVTEPSFTPPPVPSRTRSILGRVTLALALVAAGVTVLLDRTGAAPQIDGTDALAVALLVIGLGLVVGTWFGRARWLALVALLLTPVLVATSVLGALDVPIRLEAGVGERNIVVTTASGVDPDGYELGAGELRLDLSGLRAAEDVTLEAGLGAGELTVVVPEDVAVRVTARAAVGSIQVLDQSAVAGPDLSHSFGVSGAEGAGSVTLDLTVGAGQIVVRSVPRAQPLGLRALMPGPSPDMLLPLARTLSLEAPR